jgi:SpoVK/Ycf46/Vps4 family AAA+-type ATPase
VRRHAGVTTIFNGPDPAAKELAAAAMARSLDQVLYRIDLSSLVSKYIGETEKNLRRVFDEAEDCGAVLLFDEADALFGKRSEVKDAHDRYANLETSFDLFAGVAVLSANQNPATTEVVFDPSWLTVEFEPVEDD